MKTQVQDLRIGRREMGKKIKLYFNSECKTI